MHKISILFIVLLLTSCGKKKSESVKLVRVNQAAFSKFINPKNLPADPNLTTDRSFINTKYPIELALYADHKFYYNLPRLGDGTGTWKYKDGKIELFAKQVLFDMNIDIFATEEEAQELAIQFTDRFGINTLKMNNSNI